MLIDKPTIFITVALTLITIVVPRKYFLAPFVLAACFVPTDQRFIIWDMDFTVLRILIAVGVMRILLYGEISRVDWNRLVRLILLWAICGTFIYIIQWMNSEALVNRLGFLFDILGLYWIFRQRIRSWEDVKFVTALLAVSAIILLPLVIFELISGHNPFTVLGRVMTGFRYERYRCQAAFPHSIMLGLFWATLVPLFVGLGITEDKKMLYFNAAAASILIVIATSSSTPLLVLAGILMALILFKWRRFAPVVSLIILVSIAVLHIVMNAPVWHLLARINVIGGSTGWHRYNLINQALKHFDEWFLLGCRGTEHWGFGLGDVTNQFILEGVRGGLLTLLIFLAMIYLALKTLLNLSLKCRDNSEQCLTWCIFTALIGHCTAFLGVAYFGQITMLWYMMLATVSLLVEYKIHLEKTVPNVMPVNLSYSFK